MKKDYINRAVDENTLRPMAQRLYKVPKGTYIDVECIARNAIRISVNSTIILPKKYLKGKLTYKEFGTLFDGAMIDFLKAVRNIELPYRCD